MTPQQFNTLVEELRGLGTRVSWLERTVYGAVGAILLLSFLIGADLIKFPGGN